MAGFPHSRRRFLLRRGLVSRLAVGYFAYFLIGFIILCIPRSASAQDVSESDSLLVANVSFLGDLYFPQDQLKLYVRTRNNRRLAGIPGAYWWKWLYSFGSNTLGGGAVGRIFMATGEPPSLLDSAILSSDVEQLRLFYEREGFRSATVTSEVQPLGDSDKVSVVFHIQAGAPTFIRRVAYNGLHELTSDEQNEVARGSLLSTNQSTQTNAPSQAGMASPPTGWPSESAALTWQPSSLRYSAPILLEERRRLLTYLKDQGFALVGRDSIHAIVYPVSPDSFDVTIDIKLGPRFTFGDLDFNVSGVFPEHSVRTDSLFIAASGDQQVGGAVRASFTNEPHLDFALLTRTLQFRPGDDYSQARLLATKRRLDATGVFSFTDIGTPTTEMGPNASPRISHQLNLRTRVRHQVRFETFMQQRQGALADTDNELGMGLGVTYSNQNLFGGGEALRLRSTGSIAVDLGGIGGFTSAQWESSASLSYPYLTFPLGKFDRLANLYDARSQLTVSLLAARRDALRLTLRGRGGFQYRFELRQSESLTTFLDLVEVSISNPDTLAGFKEIFLDDVLNAIDDPVQRAQIIEDYTRPQFNNALRYTVRSATSDPFRRENGHHREFSAEVGGNLGRLLDGLVFTPGTVEGTIPGLGIFGSSSSNGRMIYRPYLRFLGDFRRYRPLNSRNVLATKLVLGVAHPTGASDVVPFDRRFYAGGASSVRAWRLRELGPGSSSLTSGSDSLVTTSDPTNILGGDIKIEMSAELRTTVIRSLFSANWIVALFVDAGNVWLGPRNPGNSDGRFHFDQFVEDFGVGGGFGLRLGWDYLIVRLDAAYKIHDPLRKGEFLPDGMKEPVLQFGIGHTF